MQSQPPDPYSAPASPELIRLLSASPPVDDLLEAAIEGFDTSELASLGRMTGSMAFRHYGLRGPPGRLHGGLHAIARTLLVARGLGASWPATEHFPCGLWVRIGAAIPMAESVSFEASFAALAPARRVLRTRFMGTQRLEGLLFDWPSAEVCGRERRAAFAARYEAARASSELTHADRIGVHYTHHRELTFARFDPTELALPDNPWRRFTTRSGRFSIALASYQLDNTAATSRVLDLEHPCFTTRLALAFAAREIPSDRPLVFISDCSGRFSSPYGRARPVSVRGVPRGTETTEVMCASETFDEVYAHGFVDTHPM